MLSIPAGDSDEDEETEGLAAAIETGELVYDARSQILRQGGSRFRDKSIPDRLRKISLCGLFYFGSVLVMERS